jgi:hypothetical protein
MLNKIPVINTFLNEIPVIRTFLNEIPVIRTFLNEIPVLFHVLNIHTYMLNEISVLHPYAQKNTHHT